MQVTSFETRVQLVPFYQHAAEVLTVPSLLDNNTIYNKNPFQ